MNAKSLIAAAAIALAGTSAMAIEATQDDPAPASSGPVTAATGQDVVRSVQLGEATQFVDVPTRRDRAEVRAEGVAAAHDLRIDPLYVGS